MNVLVVVGFAAASSAASLLAAERRSIALGVGLAGLLAVALLSAAVDGAAVRVGGVVLVAGPLCRFVLAAGAWTGLALTIVGLASGWAGNLPAATLATLAALGVALSAADPLVALAAAAGAGLAGSLVAIRGPGRGDGYVAAARHARTVVAGLALGVAAAAVVGREAGVAAGPALSVAYVAVALAVAIRVGAIPFHLPAASLARSSPTIALPLLLAWAPAGLAAVALAWTDELVAPLALPLATERGLVVAVAAATIVFAAVAAWLAEEIERTVGYLTIQSAGYLVLGMAVLDPGVWRPVRAWLLIFLLVSAALAAWAVAVRAAYETGRIEALDGWARRAPLLGAGLLVAAIAIVGWPGSWTLDARLTLARLAVGDPFRTLLVLAGFLPIAVLARLLLRGLYRPGPAVAVGHDQRAHRPALPRTWPAAPRDRVGLAASVLVDAWRLDRAFVAAVLVLLLAAGGIVGAAGGLGVPDAAAAPAPASAGDVGPPSGVVQP